MDGSEVKHKHPKKVKEFIHQRVKEIGEKEPNGEAYFYEWEEKN